MAEFLHEIIKKRDEHARIDAMIHARDPWADEEVMEPEPAWQQQLIREMQVQMSYWISQPQGRPF